MVFFTEATSGPARRMESLLAHVERKERERLRVRRVDAEKQPHLVERFSVRKLPTLVLVRDKKVIDRIDGRASMTQIEALIELHLSELQPA